MDFRIDATNALNHVTYPSWNTIVNSAQFGLPIDGQCDAQRAGHRAGEVLMHEDHFSLTDFRAPGERSTSHSAPGAGCSSPATARGCNSDRRSGQVHDQHATGGRNRHGEGQERQADRRPDREGLHHHRRRRAADHQLLRIPEAGRDVPAELERRPEAAGRHHAGARDSRGRSVSPRTRSRPRSPATFGIGIAACWRCTST